ncbi:MAG TPA: sigma 54-interacting transcriptional regulator [Gemmatimonadales bacterium]|jgi:DNA-binding NtrC family response regulator|nr:sigma 54-interacting transcriptional regulator [Gemmatimonadales bacterium]
MNIRVNEPQLGHRCASDFTPASAELAARWTRWAALPYPILIRGERGTGKTALAAWIHSRSARSTGPFVNGSLAQTAKGLETGDLLGHRKGAFTNAIENRAGIFERAHGGTAFLDELGRATPEALNALLGFLDHRRVMPLGASRELVLDVRLVAATNANLEALVGEGLFPADLLDRFGYYTIEIKPLRERRAEILSLARELLDRESRAIGRDQTPILSAPVQRLLLKAPWPGNIRELVKLAEYAAGNSGESVQPDDLPAAFLASLGVAEVRPEEPLSLRAFRMVEECGGNKTLAARRLGKSRTHLHRLLKSVASA